MTIRDKVYPDGVFVIYTYYKASERAGALGCFQVNECCIECENGNTVLVETEIDPGRHFFSIEEVFKCLSIDSSKIDYREEIVE